MSLLRKNKRAQKRAFRVRSALKTNKDGRPRVSVFKSTKYIYAQLIDDVLHKTIASCSSLELGKEAGDKQAQALAVGKELAKRAQKQGVQAAFFDRGRFLYHGRIRKLAEGLREGGLSI